MKNYLCILLLFISISITSGNDTSYYTFLDSISFRLSPEYVVKGKKVKFLFPPLGANKSYSLDNLEAVGLKNASSEQRYGITIRLGKEYVAASNQLINLKLYASNIDSLHITVKDGREREIGLAAIALKPDLTYYNISRYLHTLFKQNEQIAEIREINIYYIGDDRDKRLILNDLQLYTQVRIDSKTEKGIAGAIMNHYHIITNNNSYKGYSRNLTPKNVGFFKESNDIFTLNYPINRQFNSTEQKTVTDNNTNPAKIPEHKTQSVRNGRETIENVHRSIKNVLVNYFNSTERSEKKYLLNDLEQMKLSSSNLTDYYNKLKNLLVEIGDIHVGLVNRYDKKLNEVTLPLYFYKISDNVVVCGVYDTLLNSRVNLGDILISVNGIPVEELLEKLNTTIPGSTHEVRTDKIVQKLLAFIQYDLKEPVITLTLRGNDRKIYELDLTEDEIFKNTRLKLPDNIIRNSKRFRYEKKDGIAYLKIGRFQTDELKEFLYSVIDSVMTSKSLIIDLRNNPGGDISGALLYSFFIDRPEIFFSFVNVDKNLETLVVNPDPYYQYTKPVAVIFDSRTTCAAEFFLSALHNSRNNVTTFSAGASAGSAQSVKYLELPATESFNARLTYRHSVLLDRKNENIDVIGGIKPDIWVSLNSYYDLAPFNDKLLNTATEWLSNRDNKDTNKNELLSNPIGILGVCISILSLFLVIVISLRCKK